MLTAFFSFLAKNSQGIWLFLLALATVAFFVHWTAWVLGRGRFDPRRGSRREDQIQHVMADLLVKIIDDFRHLLALMVFLLFAVVLILAMLKATSFDQLKEAVSVVAAAMGGLIGTILGYYFGESAGRAKGAQNQPAEPVRVEEPEQDEEVGTPSNPDGIEPAPDPPPGITAGEGAPESTEQGGPEDCKPMSRAELLRDRD